MRMFCYRWSAMLRIENDKFVSFNQKPNHHSFLSVFIYLIILRRSSQWMILVVTFSSSSFCFHIFDFQIRCYCRLFVCFIHFNTPLLFKNDVVRTRNTHTTCNPIVIFDQACNILNCHLIPPATSEFALVCNIHDYNQHSISHCIYCIEMFYHFWFTRDLYWLVYFHKFERIVLRFCFISMACPICCWWEWR